MIGITFHSFFLKDRFSFKFKTYFRNNSPIQAFLRQICLFETVFSFCPQHFSIFIEKHYTTISLSLQVIDTELLGINTIHLTKHRTLPIVVENRLPKGKMWIGLEFIEHIIAQADLIVFNVVLPQCNLQLTEQLIIELACIYPRILHTDIGSDKKKCNGCQNNSPHFAAKLQLNEGI